MAAIQRIMFAVPNGTPMPIVVGKKYPRFDVKGIVTAVELITPDTYLVTLDTGATYTWTADRVVPGTIETK